MLLDTSIISDGDESRIYKADAGACTKATGQVQTQLDRQTRHPLHEASIADELWEFASQIHCHILLVLGFEDPILAPVKVDHARQYFTVTQLSISLSSPLAFPQQPPNLLLFHSLAKIIDSAIQFQ